MLAKLILAAGLIGFSISGYSQKTFNETKVGDILPDLQLDNILNYPTNGAKISDFKAELVIIDFWATWCAPCISAFPKLESLQKHFKGKVQIIPVTKENKHLVKEVLTRMKAVTSQLPITVTGDVELSKRFPHVYLPHYVWLNKERMVIAITDGSAVNEKNIKAFLSKASLNLPVKKDQQIRLVEANGYNVFAPSLLVKNGNNVQVSRLPKEQIGFSSVLTGYIDGAHPGFTKIDSLHFFAMNFSVKALYRLALYGTSTKVLNVNNVILDFRDSSLIDKISSPPGITSSEFFGWLRYNGYSYELKLPPGMGDRKFEVMLKDLNNYFGVKYGLEGMIEKRSSNCLVLERFKSSEILKTDGTEKQLKSSNFHINIKNYPISVLVAQLALPLQNHPMILDETGLTDNVNIEVNCLLSDLNALNKELQYYGLRLVERKRLIQIAVIKDVKKY